MKKNLIFSLSLGLLMPIFLIANNDIRQEYIFTYRHIALEEMQRAGIPASIKMAQAMLESGSGTSTLALEAKNHFGIKCGKDWSGKKMYRKDDDYDSKGRLIASCFRKYNSVTSSFKAHSQFLLDNRRYAFLFDLDPTDYRSWARGLKKAGYATSSTYANKLIQIIEEYELYLLDIGIFPDQNPIAYNNPQAPKKRPVKVQTHSSFPAATKSTAYLAVISLNDVKNVRARVGDTPAKIARETQVNLNALLRYNEHLNSASQQLNGGERIFLQPKRNNYRGKKKYHFVKAGESMFDIAQLYGLKLNKLYEKNRLDPGYEPAAGEKIKIRGRKVRKEDRPQEGWVGNRKPIVVDDFEWEEETKVQAQVEIEEEFLDPIETTTIVPSDPIETWKASDVSSTPVSETEEIIWEEPVSTPKEVNQERVEVKSTIAYPKPHMSSQIETDRTHPKISAEPKIHVVSKGETLYRISKYYGISVEELKAKNDLRNNVISVGQKLKVN